MLTRNPSFEIFNDFFDAIYVLTLKRARDRQERLRKSLKGLNWRFFYGVDKHDLDLNQVKRDRLYDDALHRQLKRTHRSMNLGEIACALSHRAIYEDVLEKGYRNALILEDDVKPNPDFGPKFEKSLTAMPADWELLMLGYYSEKYPNFFSSMQIKTYQLYHRLKIANWHKVDRKFIQQMMMEKYNEQWLKIGKLVGGHAYAVSHSACEALVTLQTPVVMQADRVFSYETILNGLKGYAISEKVFGLSEMADKSYIEYPNLIQKARMLSFKN